MLRERKSKQQMQQRIEASNNPEKKQFSERHDMMLMDEYINLNKKPEKVEEDEAIEQEPEPEPAFFKS
jgi:hypothetical protein